MRQARRRGYGGGPLRLHRGRGAPLFTSSLRVMPGSRGSPSPRRSRPSFERLGVANNALLRGPFEEHNMK